MMDTIIFWLSNLLIFAGFAMFGYSIYEAVLLGYKKYKEGYIKKVGNELNKNFMAYSPERFYKNTILAAVGMAIVGYLLFDSVLFLILFGAIGYFLPKMFLYMTARKRAEKLEVQLVDALYVLSNSVSAGLTLPQACEVVSKQLVPPVSQEFGLLVNEIRLGVPFDKALENMAERLRSNNFDLLVTAILISRQTGGNIAEIFKKLAESIKEIMRLEAKVKALTAQGRMQAVVLGGMPFALAFVLASISPDLMQPLFNTPQGTVILFVAALFWLLGIYFLRKVINIDI
ncbi:tight adherence protein B [Thermotomaculum hydrothermale]|uniref:Tight adherence protein B n=1 Tax=Thermotomaculum hydrothermale TaxID=981385 RepID=A0A7R6PEN8_9BACT|nr:type II secretion system F family protein [Thermotomaculum hydrothermale]BBB32329.1 tight adherence protein B [Thermotomaculum hydrothermale]